MAVLAVAGLGAWGSAALGLGWQAGWLLGSTVGSLLFNKTPNAEGPRLSDLTVTSSAYGAPIPIGYGTLRMAGNIIWSSGIREEKHTERVGKGGGAKQTSYSYFASFALALAEGPAEDVLRLWADGKLIFDKTGSGSEIAKSSFALRFYPGSETQLPDPLIEAREGTGNVPAHRGLCYLVFEDLALEDFGNRIPNITAELTFKRASSQPIQVIQTISTGAGGLFSGTQKDELTVDWRRGYGYLLTSGSGAATSGIRRFTLRSMTEDRQVRMDEVTSVTPNNFPTTLFCGADSHLYLTLGSGNSRPIARIEPDGLREVARFGSSTSGLINTTATFVTNDWAGMISAIGAAGRVDFLLTGSIFNDPGLLAANTMSYVWGAGQKLDESRIRGVVGGKVAEGYGEGWILGSAATSSLNHTSLGLYCLGVSASARYDSATGVSAGVEFTKAKSFLPTEIEATATGFWGDASALCYDETDDSVLFQVQMSNAGVAGAIYTLKYRCATGIVWKTQVPIKLNYEGPGFGQSRLSGGRWTLRRASRIIQLDTTTGAIVLDETWPGFEDGAQVYDSLTDTLIVRTTETTQSRLFLNRGAGEGENLATIVSDLCARAGLGFADIDVSDLDAAVPGYVLSRSTTVRAALEPLAKAFFFDGVESDDQLAFRSRGREPVATLNADLLMPLAEGSGEAWREQRTQEVELPERVTVLFMDPGADYQQGAQSAKRIANPVPTMASRTQIILELPLVLSPDTAKSIAAKTLYAAWIERSHHEAKLPTDYLRLEPTDVVDVTLPSGATHRIRIERVDLGADYSLALKGVSQEAASYSVALTADGGSGRPPQLLAGDPATKLILPDLPLLRDIDDTGGAGSRVYAMMGGYGAPNWPGAGLYRSADQLSWGLAGRSPGEIAWGATQTALSDTASPFATDETSTLRVFMATGADRFESVTQDAMLNGANAALVLKANGEPEIIQFRDVTPQADASLVLSGLLRGRRGTDIYTAGHQAGETFVLLEPATIEPLLLALGDLGLSRHWRAVGIGQYFDMAETSTRIHRGRDLMPYAVVQVQAVMSGSDVLLSWQRRTRLGGEWKDGTGAVPLGEASEAYEVEILSGPGGAVKRTLTSSTPSLTYLAADIAADFGSLPAALSIDIYQLSATIGRGLPRTVTLEIA